MLYDDDCLIVARVLAGDTEEFRTLVDRYSDRLYRFCRARLGDDGDAEDAVQDVFVRAYRSLRSFDASRNWGAWLFAIAANRVRSRYAARASAAELAARVGVEATVAEGAFSDDPEKRALDELAAEELRAAVGRLPATLRAPVELFYFAGLGVADAAKALGLGEEAVKSRLFRARRRLSRLLDEYPQPSGPGKGKR